MITYTHMVADIEAGQLAGFFVGWPAPPDPATHLRLLVGSDLCVLAFDNETQRVVGFVTALTDGVLCACIPLLEVLPDYQRQGIGRALLWHMRERLEHLYMIDLVCDPVLQPFYEKLHMQPVVGMVWRNYARQAGTNQAARHE